MQLLDAIFEGKPYTVNPEERDWRDKICAAVKRAKAGDLDAMVLKADQGDVMATVSLAAFAPVPATIGGMTRKLVDGLFDDSTFRVEPEKLDTLDFASTRHTAKGKLTVYRERYSRNGIESRVAIVGEEDWRLEHPEHAVHVFPAGIPVILTRQGDLYTGGFVWD